MNDKRTLIKTQSLFYGFLNQMLIFTSNKTLQS